LLTVLLAGLFIASRPRQPASLWVGYAAIMVCLAVVVGFLAGRPTEDTS
jgi:hypothetical protein